MKLLDIALVHEFGVPGKVPERSFVRAYVDANETQIREWQRALIREVAQGNLTVSQALNQLGARVAAGMQERIASNIPPALSQETIDRKGSSVALIDTGQLRASLTWKVREEK